MCGDCVSYKVETECFMGLAHRDNEAGGGGGGKRREVVEPVEDGRGECARCCDAPGCGNSQQRVTATGRHKCRDNIT